MCVAVRRVAAGVCNGMVCNDNKCDDEVCNGNSCNGKVCSGRLILTATCAMVRSEGKE